MYIIIIQKRIKSLYNQITKEDHKTGSQRNCKEGGKKKKTMKKWQSISLNKFSKQKTWMALTGVIQGLGIHLHTWKVTCSIPGNRHVWVVGQVLGGGVQETTNCCFCHTLMFLSLSFSFPSPLFKNKLVTSLKKDKEWLKRLRKKRQNICCLQESLTFMDTIRLKIKRYKKSHANETRTWQAELKFCQVKKDVLKNCHKRLSSWQDDK